MAVAPSPSVADGPKCPMTHGAEPSEEADPLAPGPELAAHGQISWQTGTLPAQEGATPGCHCPCHWGTGRRSGGRRRPKASGSVSAFSVPVQKLHTPGPPSIHQWPVTLGTQRAVRSAVVGTTLDQRKDESEWGGIGRDHPHPFSRTWGTGDPQVKQSGSGMYG